MCASVYILPKWKSLHLEFFIGPTILIVVIIIIVALIEAYFLYHYLETVAMNIGQEWQSP
jgi:hypothetical protein